MNEGHLLKQIGSKSPITVISGLTSISEYITSGGSTPDFADHVFHSLIPLLNHNHYKIRSMALAVTEYIFLRHFHHLSEIMLSFPLLVFSLSSVNQNIVKSASVCLRILFDTLDVNMWWKQTEEAILTSKSRNVKIQVLECLKRIPNRIPLKPIVKLIDDPVVQIRNLAEEILLAADFSRAKEALAASTLSFSAHQKFFQTFMSHEERSVSSRISARQASVCSRISSPEDEPTSMSDAKHAKLEVSQCGIFGFEAGNAANLEVSQCGDFDRHEERTEGLEISRGDAFGIASEQHELCNDSQVIAQVAPVTRKFENHQTSVYIPGEASDYSEYEEHHKETKQEEQQECSEFKRPIRAKIERNRVDLAFSTRDLSRMTWLEKTTYLEMMDSMLNSSARITTSGTEMLKCAMSAAFPLHRKTSPLLASVISKLILMYPESLQSELPSIVEFVLHVTRTASVLPESDEKDLLEAVVLEADPVKLVEAALEVVSRSKRPLLLEQFVILVYEQRPEIVLPRQVLANLLSFLLYNRTKSDARDQLLTLVGAKETHEVIKFYRSQPPDIRKVLRPFIPVETQKRTAKRPEEVMLTGQRSQQELKSIIEKEMKSGSKGNFKLLCQSLLSLSIDDTATLLTMFRKFLLYLADLNEGVINANHISLNDVCSQVFGTNQLLSVFNDPAVKPGIITGMSIYVWHCPMAILGSAAAYYPRLYQLFRESDGERRSDIIKIAVAVEQVTNKSFLSLQEITKQHRNVINNLLSQFQVSKIEL